jgi:hypothetical protein
MKKERNDYMDAIEFKKLLFKTAFCCIACDGHIDDREVAEMKYLDKNTSYFGDTDLSKELDSLIEDLKSKGKHIVYEFFEQIRKSEISFVQELLMLEITFRLIHSDEKIDDNEVKFLRLLRSHLKVYDEIIIERFGEVNLLFDKKYFLKYKTSDHKNEFIEELTFPELSEIKNIDFSKFDAKQ